MAVDLADLVPMLKSEMNPPGEDLYPSATDQQWLLTLIGGFWDARLHGLMLDYEENVAARGGPASFGQGVVTPLKVEAGYDAPSGWSDRDLSPEMQQLVVLWSAWKATLSEFKQLSTTFRAKAGPTEYEEQRSATVLKEVLTALRDRIKFILDNLSTHGRTSVSVFDAVVERSYSQAMGDEIWVR